MGTSKAELINNSPKKVREATFFHSQSLRNQYVGCERVSILLVILLRSLILLLSSCKCFNVDIKTPPQI